MTSTHNCIPSAMWCLESRSSPANRMPSANISLLGASFSVAELLTVLYYERRARNVILSKGHAAPMQYACLFGAGRIGAAQLRSYKNGAGALQAHTDTCTPGILVNSGSLGQALSKAAGMAL